MSTPEIKAHKTPSVKRRMASLIYELMLLFGVIFIAGYLFGTLSQTKNAMDNRLGLQLFVFVIFGIYFVWLWSKGQTLAMKTWKIAITDLEGKNISQKQALIRYLYSWIWVAPPVLLAYVLSSSPGGASFIMIAWVVIYAGLSKLHPDQQFWHDAMAGTRLIDTKTKA
jgi:uncharacterized RDD family membrane protein YckC